MKQIFQSINNEIIIIEISGKSHIKGTIIDSSNEILVIHNGKDFIYIPFEHIQNIKLADKTEDIFTEPKRPPTILTKNNNNDLSLTNILSQAQGMYLEIHVTGNQPLHGYISAIMNDYFVFYSPIYKTMYIAQKHLKWLIPYTTNDRPYELSDDVFPIQANKEPLASTFSDQIQKMKDKLVIFNLGKENNTIGKINKVNGRIIEFRTARAIEYLNLQHIRIVHCV